MAFKTIVAWISDLANPGPAGVGDHQAGETVGFPLTQALLTGASLDIQAMSSTFTDAPDLPLPSSYGDPERNGLGENDLYEGITEHLFFTEAATALRRFGIQDIVLSPISPSRSPPPAWKLPAPAT